VALGLTVAVAAARPVAAPGRALRRGARLVAIPGCRRRLGGRRGHHHLHGRGLLLLEQPGEAGLLDDLLDPGPIEEEDDQDQQDEGHVEQAADGIPLSRHAHSNHRQNRRGEEI